MASRVISPLVTYRKRQRLTRAAFTRGIKNAPDVSTVKRIENGSQCPTFETADKLARQAKTTVAALYDFYRTAQRRQQRAG